MLAILKLTPAAAKAAKLPTLVGLQAQSDPAVLHARDLVANGEIGDIVSVNMRVIVDSIPESWRRSHLAGHSEERRQPDDHSWRASSLHLVHVTRVDDRESPKVDSTS